MCCSISLLVILTKVPYFSVFSVYRNVGSNLGTCMVHCKVYVQFFFLSVGHMHAQNHPMLKNSNHIVHLFFETTMSRI